MHDRAAEPCVCGHTFEAHEHYRRGTDCSRCAQGACVSFRSTHGLRARVSVLVGVARTLRRPRGESRTLPAPQARPQLRLIVSHPA